MNILNKKKHLRQWKVMLKIDYASVPLMIQSNSSHIKIISYQKNGNLRNKSFQLTILVMYLEKVKSLIEIPLIDRKTWSIKIRETKAIILFQS